MTIQSILIGVLAIGFLIFIHELGHFLAAKWCNVKVERFAIGFGPRLLGFTWGETEYALCVVPLGGYVKMHGDAYEEFEGGEAKSLESAGFQKKDEKAEGDVPPAEPPDPARSFLKKPIPQRILIAVAGPAFNLGFAVILFLFYHMSVSLPVPVAGGIATDSPAQSAGIQTGDRVLQIGSVEPKNFEELLLGAEKASAGPVPIVIERDGQRMEFTVRKPEIPPADDAGQFGWLGIYQPFEARVGRVMPGSAAETAGFRAGDTVTAVDGKPVRYFFEMATIVRTSGGRELRFTVSRGTDSLNLTATPRQPEGMKETTGPDGKPVPVPYLIGVEPDPSKFEQGPPMSFGPALESSIHQVGYLSAFIPRVFYQMITAQRSAKEMGGPIEIVKQIGHQAEQSLGQVVRLVGLISVNLGIVNLFPIPVLDGGHILMFLVEAVNRKPVSLRVREVMQGFGLVFILGMMVIALYNDIVRNFIN